MTAFGNAKLDHRERVELRDLPEPGGKRSSIGFVQ
jgi:ATP-dependent Lon protease